MERPVDLKEGDVVAVHGVVKMVAPPIGGGAKPTLYKVQFPGVAPIYFTSDQIASLVSRRLERGDFITVKNGRHRGRTGRVLATDETFAFVATPGEEPYAVHLTDVLVLSRATDVKIDRGQAC